MNCDKSLAHILRKHAQQTPNRTAFVFLDERGQRRKEISYRDLDDACQHKADELIRSGMKGQRVVIFSRGDSEAFIVDFMSCLYAGAVAVPLHAPNPNSKFDRLAALLKDCSPAMLLGIEESTDLSKRLEEFARGANGSREIGLHFPDIAMIQYTSGSTSQPRGVMVSHENILQNQRLICQAFGHNQDTVVVGWLPLFHDMGLIGNVMQPIYLGAMAVLMSPMSFLMRPKVWLQSISDYRGTTSGGPDFCYRHCVRKLSPDDLNGLDLSTWRVAFNGSEPVRQITMDRFADALAGCGFRRESFFPCYGLAEATLFVSGSHEARIVDGFISCGSFTQGTSVQIVDPLTKLIRSECQIGEVWIRGPCVATGYWGGVQSETFAGYLADSGDGPFLRTGDLGFVSEGSLFVTGRLKDSWIISGANYYPEDIEYSIENANRRIRPGRIGAFVTDEMQVVIVCEIAGRGLSKDELSSLCADVVETVASEHSLRVVDVVLLEPGGIPLTTSGKIRRSACREGYYSGRLGRLQTDR